MKKYLRALFITMLASLSIGLAACDKTPDGTNENGASGDNGNNNQTAGTLTSSEVYEMLPKTVTLQSGVTLTVVNTQDLFSDDTSTDVYSYYENGGTVYIENKYTDNKSGETDWTAYGNIGDNYYYLSSDQNGVYSRQRTKRDYNRYVSSIKDTLESLLQSFQTATSINAETSREMLGSDYKVEYSGERSESGCTLKATANFVMNVPLLNPGTSLYNVWYWPGETTALQMKVNATTDAQGRYKSFDMQINRLEGYAPNSKKDEAYGVTKITFDYGFEKSLSEKDLTNLQKFNADGKTTVTLPNNSEDKFPDGFETTYTRGTEITLPVLPNKNGLDFEGWYFDSDFDEKIENNKFIADENVTTVYPKWQGKTPVLHLDGGELVTKISGGTDGAKQLKNATTYADLAYVYPLKEGYAFCGWYKDEALNDKIDYYSRDLIKGEDLYAKYEKVITLTPVAEGLSYKLLPQKGRAGYKAYLPETEPELGTMFKCWKYATNDSGGEEWNGCFPDEDRKIYAYLERGFIVTAYDCSYYDDSLNAWVYDEAAQNAYKITIPRSGDMSVLAPYFSNIAEHFNLTRSTSLPSPEAWRGLYDRFNYFAGDGSWYFDYFTDEKSVGTSPANPITEYPESDITVYATYTPHEIKTITYKIKCIDEKFKIYYDAENEYSKRSAELRPREELESKPEYSQIELIYNPYLGESGGINYYFADCYTDENLYTEFIYPESSNFIEHYELLVREQGDITLWINAKGMQYVRIHFPENPDGLKVIELKNDAYFTYQNLPCPLTAYAGQERLGYSMTAYGDYKNYIPSGKVLLGYYFDEACTLKTTFGVNSETDFDSAVYAAQANGTEYLDFYAKFIDDVHITFKEDPDSMVADNETENWREVVEYIGFGYYMTGDYQNSTDTGYTTDKFDNVKSQYKVVSENGEYKIVEEERDIRDLQQETLNDYKEPEITYENSYEKLTHLREFPKDKDGNYTFSYTWWLETCSTEYGASLDRFMWQMCVYEFMHYYNNGTDANYFDYLTARKANLTDESGNLVELFTVTNNRKNSDESGDDKKGEVKNIYDYTFLTGNVTLYVNQRKYN